MSELTIEAMPKDRLHEAVDIHLKAFPMFFLSTLGRRFLRCLYEEIGNDATGIVLCCSDGRGTLGFVAGTTRPAHFYRRLLLRRWWRFALAAMWPTLRKPSTIPRVLNAFRKPAEAPRDNGCAELMSIAVSPSAQGAGIGKLLARAFLDECSLRGAERAVLTTDASANDAVNRFYRDFGFRLDRTFVTPQGRAMNEYSIGTEQHVYSHHN